MNEIKIGDKFMKQLLKSKYAECEVVDIIIRTSTATGNQIGFEYIAKCIYGNYAPNQHFEVSKATIMLNKINYENRSNL